MFQKMKAKLEKIQNSSEKVKRRWLIIATIISMILVISLWLIYIDSSSIWANNNKEENKESTTGFWDVFKTGTGVITGSIKENINDLISKLKSDRTIDVNPAN
jgi:hypothetical protein